MTAAGHATVMMVPTLWRSHHLEPFLDALHKSVSDDVPVRPLFLAQDGDDDTLTELEKLGADYQVFPTVDGGPMTMVAKYNHAQREVTEPFLFTGTDDIRFTPGCLERLHEALLDPDKHLAGASDRISAHVHDGNPTGHCLVRMSYLREHSLVPDEPNMLIHSGYWHYFCDLEQMQVSVSRGGWVSVFDAVIDHPHPNNGTAPHDKVHRLGLDHYAADAQVYESRRHLWEAATTNNLIST